MAKPENDVSLDDILGGGKTEKQVVIQGKGPKSATDYAAEAARSVMGEGPDGDSDNYENKPIKKIKIPIKETEQRVGMILRNLDVNVTSDLARRGFCNPRVYTSGT